MRTLILLCLLLHLLPAVGQMKPDPVGTIYGGENTPVHDPVMIQQNGTYYLFCTGFGITVLSSTDMKTWKKEPPVFQTPPAWAVRDIPGFRGHIWAPDISYHNGTYYLYYSVSAFGKNTSCIGLAVNKTLDPTAADYQWVDIGKIIQSVPGRDMWNAIDPNLIFDGQVPWLSFGSFWNGLKLVRLTDDLRSVAKPEEWRTIASRPRDFQMADTAAGDGAIEAPFIFRKGDYFYLFASWDYCCRAEKSDYKVVVGRSRSVTGPYLDKQGIPMDRNGGSLLIQGDAKKWFGAGHNSVYHFNGKDFVVYHGYDAADKGRSKLQIDELLWDKEGWPYIKK